MSLAGHMFCLWLQAVHLKLQLLPMPLLKSEKARQELSSKQRVLSMRERSALFLADGIRTRDELVHLLQGDIGMLEKLMAGGYLVAAERMGAKAARMTDFAVSLTAPSLPPPTASSSDTFEGKRSLATTRMFLFDIVERMFVRKMPELANHLRDQ